MPPLNPSTSDLQNPGKSTPKVQPRTPIEATIFQMTHGLVLQICANQPIILEN